MPERLSVAQGDFTLQRLPERRNELLRAWDAADEYLLNSVAEDLQPQPTPRILVINDTFGALAVALARFQPCAWSDSYLSQQATRLNLHANGLPEEAVTLINSVETPTGPFDVVLIKAPKTLAFLEDLLLRLKSQLKPTTQIRVAGMLKHLPPSLWSLLERCLGPTTTALAKKKARLISVPLDLNQPTPNNPYPTQYRLENTPYLIVNHSNVFSREQLDIGTRFFLQHLPINPHAKNIIDLGCGNGVVGLIAAERNPDATLWFVDESFMAIASAQHNVEHAFSIQRPAKFIVGNGLDDFTPESVELILCNPPFHQQQTVGDQLAYHLFKQAHTTLRINGELWVIGNRHLGYQATLQRLFGNCNVIATNPKFVILRSQRQSR